MSRHNLLLAAIAAAPVACTPGVKSTDLGDPNQGGLATTVPLDDDLADPDALGGFPIDLAYISSDTVAGAHGRSTRDGVDDEARQSAVATRRGYGRSRLLADFPKVSPRLRRALEAQRATLLRLNSTRRYQVGDRELGTADFVAVIDGLLSETPGAPLPRAIGIANRGEVHFTAYYSPALPASRVRTERFRYPLLEAPPADGRTDLPSREVVDRDPDIERRFKALAWLDHPMDVHKIQLQGSGYVIFPDGTREYLAYGCGNGRRHRSLLIAVREAVPATARMSVSELRDYIAADLPARAQLCWLNPSYVFFRRSSTPPRGALGVDLAPMISVAADPAYYPPGAVLLAEVPKGGRGSLTETRILLVHDSGSAIKGRGRLDLYTGVGPRALDLARVISATGEVYVLAPPAPPTT